MFLVAEIETTVLDQTFCERTAFKVGRTEIGIAEVTAVADDILPGAFIEGGADETTAFKATAKEAAAAEVGPGKVTGGKDAVQKFTAGELGARTFDMVEPAAVKPVFIASDAIFHGEGLLPEEQVMVNALLRQLLGEQRGRSDGAATGRVRYMGCGACLFLHGTSVFAFLFFYYIRKF